MATSVVGVDIGSRSVRAVELRGAGRVRPTLFRFHEVALPAGAVDRGEVVEPLIVATALRKLWSEGRFSSKQVALGMGNQRVLARDLSIPKMPAGRIRESLQFHVQDMLPVPITEAVLDFYPISESTGDAGPMLDGLLIAAVKAAVLGNVRAVQQAGLTAVEVDLIPFALSRLLIGRPALKGTMVLIDVGANTTSVVIAVDGVPHFIRIIPAGGADVTDAVTSGLGVDAAQAEGLKRTVGLSAQTGDRLERRAAEIVAEVTGELLTSLRNTVTYFANTRSQQAVNQILLSGGGSQLPGFAKALANITRIPVAAADPFSLVTWPRGSKAKADELRQSRSSIAVAVGLALRSLE
ncbi:MAG: type IV pilus assembly protein PilM [Microbacteriaceae bacterium]